VKKLSNIAHVLGKLGVHSPKKKVGGGDVGSIIASRLFKSIRNSIGGEGVTLNVLGVNKVVAGVGGLRTDPWLQKKKNHDSVN